ncbi:Hypothetical protein I595_1641 [Croceitalea dokdonensis DOKDO 023]|uniref:Uncharacterized protein n=2 Tax=Croceitalea TaxID=574891 RepID=A0A0P7AZJ2_9FLAO|nr:Hypothetical protein I595_1641 [Croceitalea dokdonensis DOKDO 023]
MEPSFFFGAMYVSYALGTALGVGGFIVSQYVFQLSLLGSFFTIIGILVLLMPVIMRLARNIWINFFINFEKDPSLVERPK